MNKYLMCLNSQVIENAEKIFNNSKSYLFKFL